MGGAGPGARTESSRGGEERSTRGTAGDLPPGDGGGGGGGRGRGAEGVWGAEGLWGAGGRELSGEGAARAEAESAGGSEPAGDSGKRRLARGPAP